MVARSGAPRLASVLYNRGMTIEAGYSEARQRLVSLFDRAAEDHETVIITRRNGTRVALVAADEFESYQETAYLLHSAANARRLLEALLESIADETEPLDFAAMRAVLEQPVTLNQQR